MTNNTKQAVSRPFTSFGSLDRRRFLALTATASLAAVVGSQATAQENATPSVAPGWSATDIPSQVGRTVVITGGNGAPRIVREGTFPPPGEYSGLGYQDARALAGKGATVIIASRDETKGSEAVALIKAEHPEANIRFEKLDLANLASVKAFSDKLQNEVDRVDVLINNAATAGSPDRRVNGAGLELTWATNTVGHFSLTAHLMPLLRRGQNPRIVFLSSGAARRATDIDDLQTEKDYTPLKAYALSKAALLILARDLNRRSIDGGWGIHMTATHPGVVKTFLIPSGPGPDSDFGRSLLAHPERFRRTELGALSTLYASAHPEAVAGQYYGPVNDNYEVGVSEDHAAFSTAEIAARLYDALATATGQTFG
ncbi:SDR family NAD(P)-dependent oxidoreductase [Rhizobium bangladeshense]|uniref:SDR family NAD(P)-dependent oxidoreductase n=1 Tax=Rhizobium bangladeshense TaxID=1138189 RepID=UPI001C82C64A|nr:SDR family NAD(P)-dependent oxidoreductase [Rhizobium bangladeshense]MBX4898719.1 SDR family NAD(P)-dependent oxidoreductase [Rhizobium bangladeshense]MBY3616742.1 SDR family NAD(P)-dependent oxidoreductase [Rhizobium bangladeshense]